MSQPWTGINSVVAFSLPESSFGTDTARARTMRVKSNTLSQKTKAAVVEDLAAYANGAIERAIVDQDVMGDTPANAAYKGNVLGLMLKAAFGGLAEGGGGGPTYTHTYTPSTLSSFTSESQRGDSGKTEVGLGMYCSKLVVELPARGIATVTPTWVGKQIEARDTPSPSLPAVSSSPIYIMGHECTGFVFNSTTYETTKITVTFDNKLEGLKEHGSIYIGDAQRTSRIEAYIDVELNQRSNTLKGAALAGTSAAWSVTCTDGTNSLVFSGSAAFIETHEDPITGVKSIGEKIRFRCLAVQGSAPVMTAVLTNADNTYEDS